MYELDLIFFLPNLELKFLLAKINMQLYHKWALVTLPWGNPWGNP